MNHTTKRSKPTRWNTESFKAKVLKMYEGEYTFIGEYKNNRTKMTVTHHKCGRSYEVTPSNFLQGAKCEKCMLKERSKKYTKTHEQFMNEFKALHGDTYEIMDRYTGVFNKLRFYHKECGKIWYTTPSITLSGSTCKHCYGKVTDTHSFKGKVATLTNGAYTVIGAFAGTNERTAILHNECGRTFETTPNSFISGTRCFYCEQKRPKYTDEKFLEAFNYKSQGQYSIVGVVNGATRKNEILHHECGQTFTVTGSEFLRNSGCTKCKTSIGEGAVAIWLKENGYSYQKEHWFDGCRHINPLPFDFAVFVGGSLFCLIEYEGVQHYEPVKLFGGDEGFATTQRNDGIKRKYCEREDIPLIEIPYWDLNDIDQLLDKEFSHIAKMKEIKNNQAALF